MQVCAADCPRLSKVFFKTGNIAELKKAFITQMQLLKPHMFRMMHQMSAIRSKRSHLADHEMLLHIGIFEKIGMIQRYVRCKKSVECN